MKPSKILKSLTILYAEDDPDLATSMSKTLSMFCKKVLLAKNGEEALELYKTRVVHILILDVKMPRANGIEVAKTIRKSNVSIPIILVSGYKDIDNILAAVKLHLINYLIKPFTLEALQQALHESTENIISNGLTDIKIDDGVSYNFIEKSVSNHGLSESLTKTEIAILELLLDNRGIFVNYSAISNAIDNNDITQAGIKNLFLRLRKKVGKNTIINKPEVGYAIR